MIARERRNAEKRAAKREADARVNALQAARDAMPLVLDVTAELDAPGPDEYVDPISDSDRERSVRMRAWWTPERRQAACERSQAWWAEHRPLDSPAPEA